MYYWGVHCDVCCEGKRISEVSYVLACIYIHTYIYIYIGFIGVVVEGLKGSV